MRGVIKHGHMHKMEDIEANTEKSTKIILTKRVKGILYYKNKNKKLISFNLLISMVMDKLWVKIIIFKFKSQNIFFIF